MDQDKLTQKHRIIGTFLIILIVTTGYNGKSLPLIYMVFLFSLEDKEEKWISKKFFQPYFATQLSGLITGLNPIFYITICLIMTFFVIEKHQKDIFEKMMKLFLKPINIAGFTTNPANNISNILPIASTAILLFAYCIIIQGTHLEYPSKIHDYTELIFLICIISIYYRKFLPPLICFGIYVFLLGELEQHLIWNISLLTLLTGLLIFSSIERNQKTIEDKRAS